MTSGRSPLPRLRANVLEAWAVWVGMDVGLFDTLATPLTFDALLEQTRFDRSALGPLVEALVTTGHLERDGEALLVSPGSAPFLQTPGTSDASSPYIGRSFGFLRTSRLFERYPTLLREGGGVELTPEDWSHVTTGSSAYVAHAVNAMLEHVRALRGSGAEAPRLLDVGCGSGDYTLELSARVPGLRALAIDPTPPVAEATERRLRGCERVEVRCCEVGDVDGKFDVVLLNHVIHVVGERLSASILEQCRERLAPGGQLVIQELVTTTENRGALFGLMMRLLFSEGDVYTRPEVENMAQRAGFERTRAHSIGPPEAGLVLVVCEADSQSSDTSPRGAGGTT